MARAGSGRAARILLLGGLVALAAFLLLATPAGATHGAPPTCTIGASGTTGSNDWFRSAVSVTLQATPADSTVRYSLDGGAFTAYAGPLSIHADGHHDVTCQVVDHDGRWANHTLAQPIKIDATPPTPCAIATVTDAAYGTILSSTNAWYAPRGGAASGVHAYLASSDATSGVGTSPTQFTVAIDGAAATVNVGPYVAVRNEGVHTVACTARDQAGNAADAYHHTVGIDATAPTCELSYSGSYTPSTRWYTTAGLAYLTTFDGGGSGIAATNYSIGGNASVTYSGGFAVPDGSHAITCNVRDAAGNARSHTFELRVDTQAPSSCEVARVRDANLHVDLQPINGWYAPSLAQMWGVHVYLDADDAGSGPLRFDGHVDGGGSFSIGPDASFAFRGEGERTLSCTVTDGAGHVSSFTTTLRVDGTRPTCSGSYTGMPGAAGWHRGGAFVLTAEDRGSGMWFLNHTVAGAERSERATAGALSATATITDEGSMLVTCTAIDRAGLASAVSRFQVKLDGTAPECAIAALGVEGDNGWLRSPARVSLNGSDAASGVAVTFYRIGSQPEREYRTPVSLGSDGEHGVVCRAVDAAGNVGSAQATVKIDQTAPALCRSFARDAAGRPVPSSGSWYARAIDFTLSTTDTASGIERASMELDGRAIPGVALSRNEANVTLRIDQRGTHTVTCSATDRAGNEAAPITLGVNIDDTLPTCTGRQNGDVSQSGWHRAGGTLQLSANDTGSGLASFRYTIDGGAPRAYDGPIPLVGDGNHRITCLVRDVAGNEAAPVFDVRVDATPPECALVGIDGSALHAAPLRVVIEPTDATSGVRETQYALNGGEMRPYEGPLVLDVAGIHELECLVADNAGNEQRALLARLRVDDAQADVRPAAVPMQEDATAKTPQRIPGPTLAAAALAAALAALLLPRSRRPER